MNIARIIGREIYDSRGLPTLECDLVLEDGSCVTSSVPTGRSVGELEAFDLRDGGKRLMGLGVHKAIEHLENIIGPVLIGKEPDAVSMDLNLIDLDGTVGKSRLGANAMLAASMCVYRAQALISGMETYELIAHLCDYGSVTLPLPMFNMINGGMHADNKLLIQEVLVIPVGMESFRASMEAAVILFYQFKQILEKKGKQALVGDEGGFAADFVNETEALDLLMAAIEKVNKSHGYNFMLGLDMAASSFYNAKKKKYKWHNTFLSRDQMIKKYEKLAADYPIFSIEDGLQQEDKDGWQLMTQTLSGKINLIGDDILVSNPEYIVEAIEQDLVTGVIIKPNQVGTITQALQSIKLCKEYEKQVIVSHRSGETNDTFIVDLAVGTSASYIKAGGPCRGERVAKYNQLMRVEDFLMFSLLNSQ